MKSQTSRNSSTKTVKFLWFLLFLMICLCVAGLDKFFTLHTLDPWYVKMVDSVWTPPKWIFGPIWMWGILYTLVAISGWLNFISKPSIWKKNVLLFYFLQLFLNALWFALYFYFRLPIVAIFDLILLLIIHGIMMRTSWQVVRWGVYVAVPYSIWLLYIGLLNAVTIHFK